MPPSLRVSKRFRYRQTGFMIVIVMLFLLMLSTLIIATMTIASLENKMLSSAAADNALAIQASSLMNHLLRAFRAPKQTFPVFEPLIISKQDAWWQAHSFILDQTDGMTTRAVIEYLGTYPCVSIIGARMHGVTFYRLTLRTAYNEGKDQLLLQATYALPLTQIKPCLDKEMSYLLKQGQQSWHEWS